MRDVLGFGELTEEAINAGFASLIQILTELARSPRRGPKPTVRSAVGRSSTPRRTSSAVRRRPPRRFFGG